MIAFQQGIGSKTWRKSILSWNESPKLARRLPRKGYDVNTGAGRPAPGSSESVRLELEQLDKHLFQHPNDCASQLKKPWPTKGLAIIQGHCRLHRGDHPQSTAWSRLAIAGPVSHGFG